MMTPDELRKWTDALAEACLQNGTEPLQSLKENIASLLREAYYAGIHHEQIGRGKRDEVDFTMG